MEGGGVEGWRVEGSFLLWRKNSRRCKLDDKTNFLEPVRLVILGDTILTSHMGHAFL